MNKPFEKILFLIKEFRDERNWKQFHNPKDTAMAIAIEASELEELFLWKDKRELNQFTKSPQNLKKISDEVADVFAYLLVFCDDLKIDIEKAIVEKYKENALKYPVKKSKGKATKYIDL